ncbi:MAG: hypothetical protein CNE89_11040 [Sphingomonadaceae bacterium MED-G03]|nr:MAG: hypothetical protein CNE89_11040 [Sphingomonadaceae bacterium MED-G03]
MAILSATKYVAKILWTLPAPTETWADIVGHIAWPIVVVFLVLRFRIFIRSILSTLLDRLKTDDVKVGVFEITKGSTVINLDPQSTEESTFSLEPEDVQRIESIFEFMATDEGAYQVIDWVNNRFGEEFDIEDFLTLPDYANDREEAFNEIGGLKL